MTEPSAIVEYFDALDERIETVRLIDDANHHDEALLLCCAYLDSLAALCYRNSERSHFAFVKLLTEHGSDPRLGLVHPIQFLHALDAHRSKWSEEVLKKARASLMSMVGALYAAGDFESRLSALLSADEQRKVHEHIWRGTLASIIYVRVRCELVHGIAPSISPHKVSLTATTWKGKQVGPINFGFVHAILESVSGNLRSFSIGRGELFGHGFR